MLDERDRIAIEIDGYFHFRDETAYRRDRRKDELLQSSDFLVLRFLATDVVSRIDTILSTVVTAVHERHNPETR